jgi:glycerophosphoryl diester phosphodiesterase
MGMDQVAVIAHRGASACAPEHTVAAYDLALAVGADMLELDLRSTADGVLVVVHDPTLARTTGDPRRVAEVTLEELAWMPAGCRPLTLDEVFLRYGRRTGYWLDVKDLLPAGEEALVEAIARHGLARHVGIQSFDHLCLRRVRRLDPQVTLAALYRPRRAPEAVRAELADAARFASGIAPHRVSVDAALVQAAHARGLAVRPYTVNAPQEMARLLRLGVDAVITDVPERARAVVGPAASLSVAV